MKTKLETLFEDIQSYFDKYPSIGKRPDITTQLGIQRKQDNMYGNIYTDVSASFMMDGVLLFYDVQRFSGEIGDKEKESAHNRLYNSFLMYLLTVRLPVWKTSTNSIHESTI